MGRVGSWSGYGPCKEPCLALAAAPCCRIGSTLLSHVPLARTEQNTGGGCARPEPPAETAYKYNHGTRPRAAGTRRQQHQRQRHGGSSSRSCTLRIRVDPVDLLELHRLPALGALFLRLERALDAALAEQVPAVAGGRCAVGARSLALAAAAAAVAPSTDTGGQARRAGLLTRRASKRASPSCPGRWGSSQIPWLASCPSPPGPAAAAAGRRSWAPAGGAGPAAGVWTALLLLLLPALLLLLLPRRLLLQTQTPRSSGWAAAAVSGPWSAAAGCQA
jgi:hypothetical protein